MSSFPSNISFIVLALPLHLFPSALAIYVIELCLVRSSLESLHSFSEVLPCFLPFHGLNWKPRKKLSPETDHHASTLISDFQLLKQRGNKLLFKPPGLWYCVVATLSDKYTPQPKLEQNTLRYPWGGKKVIPPTCNPVSNLHFKQPPSPQFSAFSLGCSAQILGFLVSLGLFLTFQFSYSLLIMLLSNSLLSKHSHSPFLHERRWK